MPYFGIPLFPVHWPWLEICSPKEGSLRNLLITTLAVLFSQTSTVAAQPLPLSALDADQMAWFYNRHGASPEEMGADLSRCGVFASAMLSDQPVPAFPTGLLPDLMRMAASAGFPRVYTDECMIALGYRRFNILGTRYSQFVQRFGEMDHQTQAAFVGGNSPPEGVMARERTNWMWLTSPGEPQLPTDARRYMPFASTSPLTNINASSGAPVTLTQNQAVLIVTLRAVVRAETPTRRLRTGGAMMFFSRTNPETGEQDMIFSPGIRSERVQTSTTDQILNPTTFVYVVPAGFYTLTGAVSGIPSQWVWLCLGTIGVQVSPGDVVDLGEFLLRPGDDQTSNVRSPTLGANLRMRVNLGNLDMSRSTLAASPELSKRLVPAEWRNGARTACRGNAGQAPIYGFDLPGAPSVH